jgi:lysozyme
MIYRTQGVDVSGWSGNIDWDTAAQWIPFAYYKCTEGTTGVDISFAANKMGCDRAGMPHAPYHYYHPDLPADLQAAHFVNTAGLGYNVFIVDVEEAPITSNQFQINLRKCVEKIVQLTNGAKVAIYTSAGFWDAWCSHIFPGWAGNYPLIVANYTVDNRPHLPIDWGTWKVWQFSKNFWFPGCPGTVDGNWFNGNLEECRAWFGNYNPVNPPVYNKTRVCSLFSEMHVRTIPSINARVLDHLAKGEIVEVDELGGKDVWIKHSRGWTAVERNSYRYMEVIK